MVLAMMSACSCQPALVDIFEYPNHFAHAASIAGDMADGVCLLPGDQAHEVDDAVFSDHFDATAFNIPVGDQLAFDFGADPTVIGALQK